MRNDKTKTGDELIAIERESQILKGYTISEDAKKYRNGQLVNLALALIHKVTSYAAPDWEPELVNRLVELPDEDRLIIAGTLLAAQVDVLNYYASMAELMQKHAPNVQPKILPPTN